MKRKRADDSNKTKQALAAGQHYGQRQNISRILLFRVIRGDGTGQISRDRVVKVKHSKQDLFTPAKARSSRQNQRSAGFFRRSCALFAVAGTISLLALLSCEKSASPIFPSLTTTPALTVAEVETLIAQAVEQAQRLGQSVDVAITDREGNVLGAFKMTGSPGDHTNPVTGSIAKARTAAFLSSNQHGFTSLTACFITRSHFPPGISNTPGGPLYGVPFSSIGGGDIQPNGGLAPNDPGLTGAPGGVPVFKNGLLAGGLGISGDLTGFTLDFCSGESPDEIIALGATLGFQTPADKRGDNIFLDGIRLLYANAQTPPGNFTLDYNADVNGTLGAPVAGFPIIATPQAKFTPSGAVNLDLTHDFRIKAGSLLSAAEVQQIIDQAVAQANRTRAAIRRPLGSPARVFITVADVDGTILGIWRTDDATLFSFDVSAQKARTAVAYSDPAQPLGIGIRSTLGLPAGGNISFTCRAIGFLSQDFYPPGIDEETLGRPVAPGPLYQGPEFLLQNSLDSSPFGNGITIFPGGIPLYKNGQMVGAIGVSGDGVDQDDIIAAAGTAGFEAPDSIRCDQFFFDGIRLPYVKFPRRPEL